MTDIVKRNRNRVIVRSIAMAAMSMVTVIAAAPWIIPLAKAEWEFVPRIDPIDDIKWAYAYSTSAYDWKGDRSLFLICTRDRSIEIRIDWMEYIGQDERPVIYRFDHDNPKSDIFWTHETTTGWDLNKPSALAMAGADFLQRLARSERFVARVQNFDSNTYTQIFDTKGFDRVLPSLLEHCPDYHPPTEAERQAAEVALRESARQKAEVERQSAELARQRAEIERRNIETIRRRADLPRQRTEWERLRSEEKLALADAIRSDEQRLERERIALIKAARKRFVDAIRRKIEGEWIRSPGAPEGLLCVVKVEQLPGGEIVSVDLLKSSGDSLFDRSVEAAVRATGILPTPLDPSIFDREIVITFAPEGGG